MSKRITAANIIASTFSMDLREMSEHRYQPTRFCNPAVYNFGGNTYYACGATKPKHRNLGGDWQRHADQFWADKAGSVLWVLHSE